MPQVEETPQLKRERVRVLLQTIIRHDENGEAADALLQLVHEIAATEGDVVRCGLAEMVKRELYTRTKHFEQSLDDYLKGEIKADIDAEKHNT